MAYNIYDAAAIDPIIGIIDEEYSVYFFLGEEEHTASTKLIMDSDDYVSEWHWEKVEQHLLNPSLRKFSYKLDFIKTKKEFEEYEKKHAEEVRRLREEEKKDWEERTGRRYCMNHPQVFIVEVNAKQKIARTLSMEKVIARYGFYSG